MFKQIRTLATQASSKPKFHISQPPQYTLASLRTFPSLEPHTFIPLPAKFFAAPNIRRDQLWSAVVFEADRARVGSGNVPTKGDKPFSNRKLRPQKGTGKARLGDANSPHMDNGLKAFGIKAPHDWSTDLPSKIYAQAMQHALGSKYKEGKLFIIGNEEGAKNHEFDDSQLDFKYDHESQGPEFVERHNLQTLNLLFITDSIKSNLISGTASLDKKADVQVKENVEVRDILKANRIYIELSALQWLIGKYASE
ncbi:54S ribosomal protein YmL6 mitochondrial [Spathaspora sp. JA1]|nr:54S ribosomal protein YmL6 mitochondrial [Spathaspora sp. JA1]